MVRNILVRFDNRFAQFDQTILNFLCEGAKKVKKSSSPVKASTKQVCDVPQEALLSSPISMPSTSRGKPQPAALDPDILSGTSTDPPKAEVMQKRQKEIEEENNRKRQLLLDTISERFFNNFHLILFPI